MAKNKSRHELQEPLNAFAAASGQALRSLERDLRQGRYEPDHASKLYLPKPSGALRPITLLTFKDQIVYQACANIIAERLWKTTRRRYRVTVFNHLYAGKTALYFYLKWEDSYRALMLKHKDFRRLVSLISKALDEIEAKL